MASQSDLKGGEFPPISHMVGLGAWGPLLVFLLIRGTADLAFECDLVIREEEGCKVEIA